ncbi:MAG: DEAD/DEAH box helicase [Eggerthella lenta]
MAALAGRCLPAYRRAGGGQARHPRRPRCAANGEPLLLGDVGTGKTVVAAFALAAAADTGAQALLMAPTEVLARQHGKSLGPLFDAAGISWAVLTGSTPSAEREAVLARVAEGSVDVLIGTHALLEDDVAPRRLSLVVIDEQQRFGVEQRAKLLAKGDAPGALYLTATPIRARWRWRCSAT